MYVRRSEPSTDEFVDEFIETAQPGSIPDSKFLDLDSIQSELQHQGFADQTTYEVLDSLPTAPEAFVEELANELATHAAPEQLLRTCFLLVSHSTNKDVYVSTDQIINLEEDAERSSGNFEAAREVSETLREIGLHKVLEIATDARTAALGVRIGLQTDARKGRGGRLYEAAVKEELSSITDALQRDGYQIRLDDQYTTGYKPENKDQEKTVDFAILQGEELLVAFEANCYTTGGSKVSSTEREYDDLSSKMRADGKAFIWITDGYGWQSDETSTLREAYDDVHDLYNLNMVSELLEDDLRAFFDDSVKDGSRNTLSGY
jgi:hypothetical protein